MHPESLALVTLLPQLRCPCDGDGSWPMLVCFDINAVVGGKVSMQMVVFMLVVPGMFIGFFFLLVGLATTKEMARLGSLWRSPSATSCRSWRWGREFLLLGLRACRWVGGGFGCLFGGLRGGPWVLSPSSYSLPLPLPPLCLSFPFLVFLAFSPPLPSSLPSPLLSLLGGWLWFGAVLVSFSFVVLLSVAVYGVW